MQSPGQAPSKPQVSFVLIALTLVIFAGVVAVLVYGWRYYLSPAEQRALSAAHATFKASGSIGIACGVVATALFVSNLVYLPRRRYAEGLKALGSLRSWLSWHVISGLGGAAIVFLHAAFQIKSTVGAALVASLGVVVVTGTIGRYALRWIPRGRSGELLPVAQLQDTIMGLVDELRPFVGSDAAALAVVDRMVDTVDSSKGAGKVSTLGDTRSRLRQVKRDLDTLRRTVSAQGNPAASAALVPLLRRVKASYRQAAAYQFASTFLDSWRTFHRVLALFFVVALAFHIGVALYYGFAGI